MKSAAIVAEEPTTPVATENDSKASEPSDANARRKHPPAANQWSDEDKSMFVLRC